MPRDQSPALPASVSIDCRPWPCGPIGFDDIPPAWATVADLDASGLGLAAIGFAGTLPIRDTVHAIFNEKGQASPTNQPTLDALSKKMAADFWSWRTLSFDRTYIGIVAPGSAPNDDGTGAPAIAPGPDALIDRFVLTYREDECSTRIATMPWAGNLPATLSHCDAAEDCDARVGVYLTKPKAMVTTGPSLTLQRGKLYIKDGILMYDLDGTDTLAICPASSSQ